MEGKNTQIIKNDLLHEGEWPYFEIVRFKNVDKMRHFVNVKYNIEICSDFFNTKVTKLY